jgi:hypothetical protein
MTIDTGVVIFRYFPFIPIPVRVFGDLEQENENTTDIESRDSIPSFATPIDTEGNFVWRNFLDIGYIDPLTNEGVNYPFVNGKHYIFSNHVLTIKPDFTDSFTESVFTNTRFGPNELIANEPETNPTTIGDLC